MGRMRSWSFLYDFLSNIWVLRGVIDALSESRASRRSGCIHGEVAAIEGRNEERWEWLDDP